MPRLAFTEDQVQAGRSRMLAEAQKIVARDGYAALSMRRLADAVDLTPGALYRYFVNKDEVMLALWADGLGELNDRLVRIANSPGSHVNAIKAVFTAYAAFAFEDEVRFRTMFMQHYGAAGRDFHANGFGQPTYQAIAKRIADAVEEGTFRRVDIDVACQTMWGAIHGIVALMLTAEGFPFVNRGTLITAAIDNCMRGLMNDAA
jgi:AcrR family transcriptional regulator